VIDGAAREAVLDAENAYIGVASVPCAVPRAISFVAAAIPCTVYEEDSIASVGDFSVPRGVAEAAVSSSAFVTAVAGDSITEAAA
jgi:hypothetical protein